MASAEYLLSKGMLRFLSAGCEAVSVVCSLAFAVSTNGQCWPQQEQRNIGILMDKWPCARVLLP